MKLVLLPGMDGTGALFARFNACLPTWIEPVVICYPNQAWGYEELLHFVRERLPTEQPYALLGESFSGPLAISIAAEKPAHLKGVILACTFARNPQPLAVPLGLRLRYFPPRFIQRLGVRYGLTHGVNSQALENEVFAAVQTLSDGTIWARLDAISRVNVLAGVEKIQCPMLYLRALEDRLIPHSCLTDLTEQAKALQVNNLKGPHCLLQANASGSAEAVARFLSALLKLPD